MSGEQFGGDAQHCEPLRSVSTATASMGLHRDRRHDRHRPHQHRIIRAPMPDDVNGAAMTSDGTYAYAAGGYSFSAPDYTQQLYRFDPAANMPLTLLHHGRSVHDGPSGGFAHNFGTNKVYVFWRLARHRVPS